MSRSLRRKNKLRFRLSGRMLFVIVFLTTTATFLGGWLVYLNILEWKNSRAGGNGFESGGIQSTGELLCEYSWEQGAGKATVGPDAESISGDACIVSGGRASTKGLSAGSRAKDINLILSPAAFDVDGIDISVDFKKLEPTASLFCRGRSLEFWIDRGYPAVLYKTYDVNGGYAMVNERSAYEIPNDGIFRNYRFIYSPVTGKGEIFVNGVIIWSHQGEANAALYWKDAGKIVIGKGMNGNGMNEAILDNLVIRSTGSVIPPAESLISFLLDTKSNGIQINWTVSENNHARAFIIEKSVNAIDFVKIAEVPAQDVTENPEYGYFDQTSQTSGTYYYRLKQILKSGKFVNHQPSAIRSKTNRDLCIDHVNLSASAASIDVSYFIPESGKVFIQITDSRGNVIKAENFTGTVGSNVHVLRNMEGLGNGTYTVNLIFNDRKVSRKIIKG